VARELMFRRDGMLDRAWSDWSMSVCDGDGEELLAFTMGDIGNGNNNK
jgi:hypothetical protein